MVHNSNQPVARCRSFGPGRLLPLFYLVFSFLVFNNMVQSSFASRHFGRYTLPGLATLHFKIEVRQPPIAPCAAAPAEIFAEAPATCLREGRSC